MEEEQINTTEEMNQKNVDGDSRTEKRSESNEAPRC